jgi:hypothetical protein
MPTTSQPAERSNDAIASSGEAPPAARVTPARTVSSVETIIVAAMSTPKPKAIAPSAERRRGFGGSFTGAPGGV